MQPNLGLSLSLGLPQLVVVVIFAEAIYPTMNCFTITRTAFIFPVTRCSLSDHGMHAHSLKLPHSASADVMSTRDRQSWRCHRKNWSALHCTSNGQDLQGLALLPFAELLCCFFKMSLWRHKQKDWVLVLHALVFSFVFEQVTGSIYLGANATSSVRGHQNNSWCV